LRNRNIAGLTKSFDCTYKIDILESDIFVLVYPDFSNRRVNKRSQVTLKAADSIPRKIDTPRANNGISSDAWYSQFDLSRDALRLIASTSIIVANRAKLHFRFLHKSGPQFKDRQGVVNQN